MSVTEHNINKSIQGDTRAYGNLVMSFQNMIYSLCVRMLLNEQEAQDAVQDTFVKAWTDLKNYDESKSKFSTWLYVIATRICLDKLKKRKVELKYIEDDWQTLSSVICRSDEESLNNREAISVIRVLASDLPEKQKLVFVLRDLEDLDVEEVVQITGFSEKQVKDNLYLARKTIKQKMKMYIMEN